MKLKILIPAFFLMFSNIIIAQVPTPGSNITRTYLDKFEGTWKWTNGTSEVTIQLKKLHYHFTDHQFYEDVVVGSHKFIKNGVLVENYLPDFNNISQTFLSSIFLWALIDGSQTDEISGDLQDISKHTSGALKLTYVGSAVPSLIWHLKSKGDVIVEPVITGITLPGDIVLVKQ